MNIGKHNYLIDMLRFFAAFMVVDTHLNASMPNVHNWYHNISKYGWVGVPAFFVISGYCIMLSACKSVGIKDFLLRRFFRIYPAYWVSLIIVLVSVCFQKLYLGENHVLYLPKNAFGILTTITLTTSPLTNVKTINWVYWTLTCELVFYLVVCIMLAFNKNYLLYFVTFISLIAGITPVQDSGMLFFLNHWPAFGLGACIFFYFDNPNKPAVFVSWLLFLLSITAIFNKFILQQEYIITAIITFLLIVISNFIFFSKNIFSTLGKYSYSVYLIHVPIGIFIIRTFEKPYIIKHPFLNMIYDLLIYSLISVFAWLMYKYIEEPSIIFGKKISKKYFSKNVETIIKIDTIDHQ